MKIPAEFIIAPAKFDYLLRPRSKDDKSKYLSRAGYIPDNAPMLETAIRAAAAAEDAFLDRENLFGSFYAIRTMFVGPTGSQLDVRLIFQHRTDGSWGFVTLYPDKE